ncbi:MAG: transposase [Nanoarchaeota archaeon]
MNREQVVTGIRTLRYFIDGSLGLSRANDVSGFELSEPLLSAASHNTYVETVSNKADTLYLRIKEALTEMTTYAYLEYIRRLSEKFEWKSKDFVLAFDHTDEDFYGDVQGFGIHGWTGEKGVTGKFKFLTCSIVSDDIPEKIPLVSIPALVGDYKSYAVNHCLSLVKPYIGTISLIIFDRGFYDKDLMYELSQNSFPYLIFVPKHKDKKEILYPMGKGEQIAVYNEFELKKNKTAYEGENIMVFLKEIYDPKSEKGYDWVFATNVEEVALSNIIGTYKKRWRIENTFRVQDDATIKCKSVEMKIRYFLFAFQQMLQTQWVCFWKDEVSFKKFVMEVHEVCKDIVENPKYGKA